MYAVCEIVIVFAIFFDYLQAYWTNWKRGNWTRIKILATWINVCVYLIFNCSGCSSNVVEIQFYNWISKNVGNLISRISKAISGLNALFLTEYT